MKKLFIGLSFIFSFILFSCNNIQSNQRVDDKEEQKQTTTKEEVRNNIAKYLVIEREEPQPVGSAVRLNNKKENVFQATFFDISVFSALLAQWGVKPPTYWVLKNYSDFTIDKVVMEYVDTEGNVQVLTETFLAGNTKRQLIDVNKGGKPYIQYGKKNSISNICTCTCCIGNENSTFCIGTSYFWYCVYRTIFSI